MKYLILILFIWFIHGISYGMDGCKPRRYQIELTTTHSQITGYVYDCFLDPKDQFNSTGEFLQYFLHPSDTILKVYRDLKEIKPLEGIDIANKSSIITVNRSAISGIKVIGVKEMSAATSVIEVSEHDYAQLTDSTLITYFDHPADIGGFCTSLLLSLDELHTDSVLNEMAEAIQSESLENWKGKTGISTWERIREKLLSENILYFDICGP